jgi:hypothetical protein
MARAQSVVTKGQKAIYILAPMAVKQRDVAGEEIGEKRVFYRSVAAFDTLSRVCHRGLSGRLGAIGSPARVRP